MYKKTNLPGSVWVYKAWAQRFLRKWAKAIEVLDTEYNPEVDTQKQVTFLVKWAPQLVRDSSDASTPDKPWATLGEHGKQGLVDHEIDFEVPDFARDG